MISTHPILAPVLILIAWTMVMTLWMMAARARAFREAGIVVSELPAGTRGPDLETRLDPHAQWKAHNYNHLLEQPPVFYALCLTLALLGLDQGLPCWIAWSYVVLRILHSLVQATVNVVAWRAALFGLSSLSLVALTAVAISRALA
jgi:hypothetical protein